MVLALTVPGVAAASSESGLATEFIEDTFYLPRAGPVPDASLYAAVHVDALFEATEASDEGEVVAAQAEEGAVVVRAVADVHDAVEGLAASVAVEEGFELLALAEVGAASDGAGVLYGRVGGNAATEEERAFRRPCGGVGDDLGEQLE